jgi:hypothetical protein
VAREQRKLADGSLDPGDILGQHKQVCDRCGGSGEVPANPPTAGVRKPGYAADMIALSR